VNIFSNIYVKQSMSGQSLPLHIDLTIFKIARP
jgi:hypothetical protein